MKKRLIFIVIGISIFNLLLIAQPSKKIITSIITSSTSWLEAGIENLSKIPENFTNKKEVNNNNKKLQKENTNLQKENTNLQKENDKLIAEQTKLQVDNNALKKELEISKEISPEIVIAKINYRKLNSWNQKIEINVGAKEKIKQNQLVLNESKLIGYISKVKKETSEVTLLTSSNTIFNIPVKIIHKNDTFDGMIERYQNDNGLVITSLYQNQQIETGDKIYTNGYGDNQFEGIYVGAISGTSKKSGIDKKYYINELKRVENYLEVVTV